jgi:hypothetical protein
VWHSVVSLPPWDAGSRTNEDKGRPHKWPFPRWGARIGVGYCTVSKKGRSLAENCAATYRVAKPTTRKLFNTAVFKRLRAKQQDRGPVGRIFVEPKKVEYEMERETGVVVPGTKHRVEFVYRLGNAGHDDE